MILFSPLGMTDPIRDFYDGACLHIIRHYDPRMVFLFYTAEVGKIEKTYHPYTKAIKKISPKIEIEEKFTDITDPQRYDEFINEFPKIIYALHEDFPNEEILLNLSSGTPQMKNLLAIIACDSSWTRPIQVNSPAKRASKGLLYMQNESDFEVMLKENIDDTSESENRCVEPKLQVIRKYSDKAKILSLIKQYEYDAALTIAKQNPNVSEDVKKLLQHSALRIKLMKDEAKKVLAKYDGKNLFPFTGTKEKLFEYFLTIQAERNAGNLSVVLIKTLPFLYSVLAEYALNDENLKLRKSCVVNRESNLRETNFELKRNLLEKNNPDLLAFLDGKFGNLYHDSFLSEKILNFVYEFAAHQDKDNFYSKILEKLRPIRNSGVIDLRHQVAHLMTDVDETKFRVATGMTSEELIKYFFEMLVALYGEEIKIQRNLYNDINKWIGIALEK